MTPGEMPTPDKVITIWAAPGSISYAHLTGRAHDRREVHVFGQRWTVLVSRANARGSWFELRAVSWPDDSLIMFPACGSFDLDKPDGFRWECQGDGCGWREPLPPED